MVPSSTFNYPAYAASSTDPLLGMTLHQPMLRLTSWEWVLDLAEDVWQSQEAYRQQAEERVHIHFRLRAKRLHLAEESVKW